MNYNEFIELAQDKLDKKVNKFDTKYRRALREDSLEEASKYMYDAIELSKSILTIQRFFKNMGVDMFVPENEMGKKFGEMLKMKKEMKDYTDSDYVPAMLRGYGFC